MENIDNAPHVPLAQLLTFFPEADLGARSPDKDIGCVSADMLEAEWPLATARRQHENARFEYHNMTQPGDVVLPRRQYGAQQGNVSLLISPRLDDCAELEFDRIACPACCLVLRPDRTRLDALYLLYFLRHAATRQKMDEFKQQNRYKSDPVRAFLQSCTIPLPDLAQQQQWVVQWQRQCANLMLLRKKIALYGNGQWRDLQAVFRSTRAASAKWQSINLGRLASLRIAGDGAWRNYLTETGTPLIGLPALAALRLEPARLARVQGVPQHARAWPRVAAGDVLLAIHGAPGRAVVVPPELAGAYIGPGIVSLRVKDTEPAWLAAWLCSGPSLALFESMLGMQRSGSLSKAALCKLPILLPPMELQTFVADGIAQFDKHLDQLTAQLSTQQRQFEASNQAAFGLHRCQQ